jgi:proteic killer suppression protein
VIRSFKDPEAEALFSGKFSRRLQRVARVPQRKLQQLHAARELRDLAAFPGNRLEALAGDRRGQHSIRVNNQYRICFVWHDGDADDVEIVEIVDYH